MASTRLALPARRPPRIGAALLALLGFALGAGPSAAQAPPGGWRPVMILPPGAPLAGQALLAEAGDAPAADTSGPDAPGPDAPGPDAPGPQDAGAGGAGQAAAPVPKPYALTAFAGPSIPSNFTSIFYSPWNAEFEDTYIAGLGISARIWEIAENLTLELDGHVARRFGDSDVWEFGAALLLRWDGFPWNDSVYTTVGLAVLGPSYATGVSETERRKSGNDKGSKLLNYFAPEITFSPPDNHDIAFVTRLHHRSGIFGLIDGVSGGSNFLTFGLRHRF